MYHVYVHLHICLCLFLSLFLIPFIPHFSPSLNSSHQALLIQKRGPMCFLSSLIHPFHVSLLCFHFSPVLSLSISSQNFPSFPPFIDPIPTPSCPFSSLHSHPSHHLIHLCSSFLWAYALPITTMFFHVPLSSIPISCPHSPTNGWWEVGDWDSERGQHQKNISLMIIHTESTDKIHQ